MLALCVGLAAVAGCVAKPQNPWGDTPVAPLPVEANTAASVAGWAGGVTAVGAVYPSVPHGSVELPAVSPDGKWIAYFEHAEGTPRPTPDSLLTGRGLGGVSLWVRDVEGNGLPRSAALEGACWPAWSPDSSALFFVTYDAQRRCYLGRFDAATGQVQRKAFGVDHLLAPAVSPDGRLALVGFAASPSELRLYILGWDGSAAIPIGAPADVTAQLAPRWASASDLLFVAMRQDRTTTQNSGAVLTRRSFPVSHDNAEVAGVPWLAHPADALMAQQGIHDPFDAAHAAWMARDGSGMLRVIGLASREATALPSDTAAVAWWEPPWVVAGRSSALELIAVDAEADADAAPVSLRLLSGRWAPRQVDPAQGSMTLVGMGDDPDRLAVYRLWVVVADE